MDTTGQLLQELRAFADVEEEKLGLAERVRKHEIQGKLIAFHRLGNSAVLEGLLESLEELPVRPGRAHALELASLFHRIDRPLLRDRMLRIAGSTTIDADSEPAPVPPTEEETSTGFEITNVMVVASAVGYRQYKPLLRKTLRAGDEVTVYGELESLTNEKVGDGYSTGIHARILFFDESGDEVRRMPLTRANGDRQITAIPLEKEAVFTYPLRIPRDFSGRYQAVVEVTDIHSNRLSSASFELRVRK